MTIREAKIEIFKFFRPLWKNIEIKSISEERKMFLSP